MKDGDEQRLQEWFSDPEVLEQIEERLFGNDETEIETPEQNSTEVNIED